MSVVFLSLPIELICHILLLLTPRDLSRCAMTCKTIRDAAQTSVDVQFKLELYAQGFAETPSTLDSISVPKKMNSLKKLTSLWRSDFYVNTVFQDTVAVAFGWENTSASSLSVKCGIWWMYQQRGDLYIRDCKTVTAHSHTWPRTRLSSSGLPLMSVIVDPLQDLVVTFSSHRFLNVVHAGQFCHVFSVDFRLASSQLPHPDSTCASLDCKHTCGFDKPGAFVYLAGTPAICGDRVVALYYFSEYHSPEGASTMSMLVIDWRKGHLKRHPLCERGGLQVTFHLVDERTMVTVGSEGRMTVYTLQGPDGEPQRQFAYLLPNMNPGIHVIYATPLFHGVAARPDLMPSYVPSLESQIMVLEVLTNSWPVIVVIDMVIFSEKAIQSATSVDIPWSDWGPKYTCCFPHHPSHRISVFGSKMAYALPRNSTPEPGERMGALSDSDYFYVHIWDFNERFIARSKAIRDPTTSDLVIRKPGRQAQSCLGEDMIPDHPYIAAVCLEPFAMDCFDRFVLDQDRLTLTWFPSHAANIRVVSPV